MDTLMSMIRGRRNLISVVSKCVSRKLIIGVGFFMILSTYLLIQRKTILNNSVTFEHHSNNDNGAYIADTNATVMDTHHRNATLFNILSHRARTKYSGLNEKKKRRLPQCIIAGVRKGGTRALIDFLDLHPDIVTAEKEQHFFSTHKYIMGLEYYRRFMPLSYKGQITMEKTPDYFPSPVAAQRIRKMNKNIKIIFIVKEPVIRAISEYVQFDLKKGRTKPFEYYTTTKSGEVNKKNPRIQLSLYYPFTKRWLSIFPRNQIHFANGDTLVKDPVKELNKIETFLGIPHFITWNNFYFSEKKGFFCWKDFNSTESCLEAGKGQKHPEVSPNVTKLLTDYYRPYNHKFFKLIGEDFGWPT